MNKDDGMGYLTLEFPKDRWRIAFLSLNKKSAWYWSQTQPKSLTDEPAFRMTADFLRFWEWTHNKPLRIVRAYYKIKSWLRMKLNKQGGNNVPEGTVR